jgi:hypothetical protein
MHRFLNPRPIFASSLTFCFIYDLKGQFKKANVMLILGMFLDKKSSLTFREKRTGPGVL